MRRQTYGRLPSLRAPPPFDWYQVILLGDRGTQVKVACPRSLRNGAEAGIKSISRKSDALPVFFVNSAEKKYLSLSLGCNPLDGVTRPVGSLLPLRIDATERESLVSVTLHVEYDERGTYGCSRKGILGLNSQQQDNFIQIQKWCMCYTGSC